MILTLLLVFGLISTPVATPLPVDRTPGWVVPLGSGPAAEPLVAGELVIVALSDRTLVALDITTGDRAWTAALNEQVSAPMAILDDVILLPGEFGTLTAVSIDNGAFLNGTVVGDSPLLEPVVVHNSIVVSDRRGTVSILDATSLVREAAVVVPAAVVDIEVAGDLVVAASGEGMLTAIDVVEATIAWQAVVSAPVSVMEPIGTGDVFLGLVSGDMMTVDGADGTTLWQRAHTNAPASDAAFADNAVLAISTGGDFLVLDPLNGDRIWQGILPTAGWFAADRCENQCLIATSDGLVTTYAPTAMALSPTPVVMGAIPVPPVASDGVLLVIDAAGDVYAWSTNAD